MTRAETARFILAALEDGASVTLRLTGEAEGMAEPVKVDRDHDEYLLVVLMLNHLMLNAED